jgi:uncharacterized protein (DUF608 family)
VSQKLRVLSIIAAMFAGLQAVGNASPPSKQPANDGPSSEWANVSSGLGFPLGGLGTGYCAFGQYGFVHVNFDGRPRDCGGGLNAGEWEYTAADARSNAEANLHKAQYRLSTTQASPADARATRRSQAALENAQQLVKKVASPQGFAQSSFGFVLREGQHAELLQTNPASWLPDASTFQQAQTFAYLPRGKVVFVDPASSFQVEVNAFTPLLPHDLSSATLPVQVLDVNVHNTSTVARQISVSLENSMDGKSVDGKPGRIVFKSATGEMSFAADAGHADNRSVSVAMNLAPGAHQAARFYVSWYYPVVDNYRRYYTRDCHNTGDILDVAAKQAGAWSRAIDAWHASLDVPADIKRLWFSSLSAAETATIMTADPFFIECETPHPYFNTMDVFVYANWVYMINWPELERRDMDQYLSTIQLQGPSAGLVLHSIWNDNADYVEEPTFLVRLRRDDLWYNDPAWTKASSARAVAAANRVFDVDHQDALIVSKQGKQSYDAWPMPGISSYVNSAWIYGLAALQQIEKSIGAPIPLVGGKPLDQLLATALSNYDKDLWNPVTGAWNVFHLTPGSRRAKDADTIFSDQLFGRWVVAIDPAARGVLPDDKIHSALLAIYKNNAVNDPRQHFRGWVDGMKPGHVPDLVAKHAKTFWIGPQVNLASLLALHGEETASLDVMKSIEMSLGDKILAAGEWNGELDANGNVVKSPEEPAKDSPRFAPYPRYSCVWEYLIRMVGLEMDEHTLWLKPFHTIHFRMDSIELAGMTLTVNVQKDWTRAQVDGKDATLPVALDRKTTRHEVDFLK